MNLGQVVNYFNTVNVSLEVSNLEVYIDTDNVMPFDQLTGDNTYVSVNSIYNQLDALTVRKLECEVCQVMWPSEEDQKWASRTFRKLNEASKNSIEF